MTVRALISFRSTGGVLMPPREFGGGQIYEVPEFFGEAMIEEGKMELYPAADDVATTVATAELALAITEAILDSPAPDYDPPGPSPETFSDSVPDTSTDFGGFSGGDSGGGGASGDF